MFLLWGELNSLAGVVGSRQQRQVKGKPSELDGASKFKGSVLEKSHFQRTDFSEKPAEKKEGLC